MSQWVLIFYNWIVWNICFFIASTNVNKSCFLGNGLSRVRTSSLVSLFLLFGAFSILTFFGGDISKYKEMVETIPFLGGEYYDSTMESFYINLALLVNGNFYLWKAIVYGLALIVTFLTIKKLQLNNYITLLFFIGFNLYSYGATRAVLGYAIYSLALAFLCDKNLKGFIVGAALVVTSYFAHHSLLLIILITPFCFIRLTKTKVTLSLIIFPFAVLLVNILINNVLGGDLSIFGDYLSYKIERYTDEAGEAGTHYEAISLRIQVLLRLALFIPFLFFSVRQVVRGRIDKKMSTLVTMSYIIVYVSFLFYFSSVYNNVYLYNRYIALAPFILYLVSAPVFTSSNVLFARLSYFRYGFLLLGNYTFAYLTYIAYANHFVFEL